MNKAKDYLRKHVCGLNDFGGVSIFDLVTEGGELSELANMIFNLRTSYSETYISSIIGNVSEARGLINAEFLKHNGVLEIVRYEDAPDEEGYTDVSYKVKVNVSRYEEVYYMLDSLRELVETVAAEKMAIISKEDPETYIIPRYRDFIIKSLGMCGDIKYYGVGGKEINISDSKLVYLTYEEATRLASDNPENIIVEAVIEKMLYDVNREEKLNVYYKLLSKKEKELSNLIEEYSLNKDEERYLVLYGAQLYYDDNSKMYSGIDLDKLVDEMIKIPDYIADPKEFTIINSNSNYSKQVEHIKAVKKITTEIEEINEKIKSNLK